MGEWVDYKPVTPMNRYSFKYFTDYKKWARFTDSACDCNGPCLEGIYFEDPDIPEAVCLRDLVAGKYRVSISEYSRRQLRDSVVAAHSNWTDAQIGDFVQSAIDELSRTPPAPWVQQSNLWPAHHGDFCRYIGEWDQDRLNKEASDGDGERFLMSIIQEPYGVADPHRLWGEIGTGWTVMFVFECLICDQRIAVDQSF